MYTALLLVFLIAIFTAIGKVFERDLFLDVSLALFIVLGVGLIATGLEWIEHYAYAKSAPDDRLALCYRLEHSDDLLDDPYLIPDVIAFNNKLEDHTKFYGDPWLGFVNPYDVGDIERIEISEYRR